MASATNPTKSDNPTQLSSTQNQPQDNIPGEVVDAIANDIFSQISEAEEVEELCKIFGNISLTDQSDLIGAKQAGVIGDFAISLVINDGDDDDAKDASVKNKGSADHQK